MNLLTRMIILFYVTVVLFLGCFVILYAFHIVMYKDLSDVLYFVYNDDRLRIAVGVAAGVLLLINYFLYRQFDLNTSKEKTIAFDNPSGRVSVALSALEDLIQRSLARFPEVKEGKVDIRASKRGLRVRIRMVLYAQANIPELTTMVQAAVQEKIQDIIGLDETVHVSIDIGKILSDRIKDKKVGKKEDGQEQSEVSIPFQGYRA